MSNKSNPKFDPIDTQLFTAEQWRSIGGLTCQFRNVELKTRIGDFPVGTKFPLASFIGDASSLVLVDEEDNKHGFHLSLVVGEKIDVDELIELTQANGCSDPDCEHCADPHLEHKDN